ncbi:phage antirepressor KilAC domain-containing protein [Akkermansia massiliensis]|uniref:phage antirepressor KilAC domain-containing protein n=2 Tax=Akkermansia massiliensis TaxID=2927224 RepID=UPI003EB97E0D
MKDILLDMPNKRGHLLEQVTTNNGHKPDQLKRMTTNTINRSPQGENALMPQNGVVPFQNETLNCTVRAVVKDGEPWFVAKDVCDALELRTDNLRAILEEDEIDTVNPYTIGVAQNGGRAPLIINESGLYSLILRSRKPEAKKFKKWVTAEVLPSIRKHGVYATGEKLEEMLADPDTMILTLQALKTEREKRRGLEAKAVEDSPKVLFADAVMASNSSISIRELARVLHQNHIDIGQNRLFRQLREEGYLCKSGTDYNLPTQQAMDLGLFEVKKGAYIDPKGNNIVTRTTKVTGKGQVYFVTKFLGRPAEAV